MYDKTTLGILEQVYLKPGIHKRELSKRLKLGMPSIDYALRKIDKLLKKQRSGNQINYFLDYSKAALAPALHVIEDKRLESLPAKARRAIRDFLKELEEKPILAVIFGSYAEGGHTRESDIDILLVFQGMDSSKDVENVAKRISMRSNTKLSPVYLDYRSFRDAFHNPTKGFFKNLKSDKIILAGFEWWRQLEDEEA